MRTRNDAAAQLAQSDLRIAQLQVALFRALGGGWEEAVPPGADGMRQAT
jgi:outer membrane protein TolC